MARYYDSEEGRFITKDTFHGFEKDPLSFNQYAYAKNNPVNYIDPSGYISTKLYWNRIEVYFSKSEATIGLEC
jgi:uncharacterized protein RhaS with RHS repeats